MAATHTGAITERGFQDAVVQLARLVGFEVYHPWTSVHSTAGWPDLALVKPGRLILAELKSETGRVSAQQQNWLELLETVPSIEVYLWRPSDWDEIVRVLRDGGRG